MMDADMAVAVKLRVAKSRCRRARELACHGAALTFSLLFLVALFAALDWGISATVAAVAATWASLRNARLIDDILELEDAIAEAQQAWAIS